MTRALPIGIVRFALASLLGLTALYLNTLVVNVLTAETPRFVMGGGIVLLAFVWLGWGLGTWAACLSLAAFWVSGQSHQWVTVIYLLEALWIYAFHKRLGSLVFAAALFWLGFGWLLDWLAYGAILGLSREYLALLFLKQLFNGMLSASCAEGVLLLSRTLIPGNKGALGLRDYVFARIVLAVMAPSLVLGLVYARSTYERHTESALGRARSTALRLANDAALLASQHADPEPDALRVQLRRLIRAEPVDSNQFATVIESGEQIVVATNDPTRRSDQKLAEFFSSEPQSGQASSGLTSRPSSDGTFLGRLGLDQKFVAHSIVPGTKLRVLVEFPRSRLHAIMAPSALRIAGFFGAMLMCLFVASSHLARRIALPLHAVDQTAERIAERRFGTGHDLAALMVSPLVEVRRLGVHLKAMEHALQARDLAMRESLQRKETMSQMGVLVAGVAHEVRNPLFAISATLDAAQQRLGTQVAFNSYLEILRTEVGRLSDLMEDLLEYGRPHGSALEPARIEEILDEAAALSRGANGTDGIAIEIRVAAGLPLVAVDRRRMSQVFVNLLENALQHSPRGSSVTVSARVGVVGERPAVTCEVADCGPGFHEDDRARVFEPFFTRRKGGTGLGLSIVQRIVDEHAGSVDVATRPEGGARVTVRLPSIPEARS